MTITEKISRQLGPYLPEGLAPVFASWIVDERVRLRVTKPRRAKLGDYRAPHGKLGHQISINGDLNKYAFVITFVHEFAHLHTWKKHKDKVLPHGDEWKGVFQELMAPFLQANFFPETIQAELHSYFKQTHAASCRHVGLMKALAQHDPQPPGTEWLHLDELPINSVFSMENGRVFIKGEKRRKNFFCVEKDSGRRYIISPIAKVRSLI